ncbi:MAG TPA: hypothetical protein DCZ07_14775, partial [Alphaproteobacteria bacterium]|nr:hypothetical protein [Alphaproteobacteria bacterium]
MQHRCGESWPQFREAAGKIVAAHRDERACALFSLLRERLRRIKRDQPPLLHEAKPVAMFSLIHVMGRDDN